MPDFDDEEAQDREDLRIAEERLQAIREGREKTIPLEDVMRRLGLEPFIDLELGVDQAVVSPAAISITAMAAGRSRSNCSGLDEAD